MSNELAESLKPPVILSLNDDLTIYINSSLSDLDLSSRFAKHRSKMKVKMVGTKTPASETRVIYQEIMKRATKQVAHINRYLSLSGPYLAKAVSNMEISEAIALKSNVF